MLLLTRFMLVFLCLLFTSSIFSQTTFEKFYGNDSTDDFLTNIQSTNDGGYVAVGESQSSLRSGEIHLVKFDANGDLAQLRVLDSLTP